ncbi:uncharacterized protein F4807DRAFT_443269 [Annulohypoxylon truncatum]|uniref:uncharacterized protein n=1 Tax=Annulohypoxylon truncatum TaxID=327061 RepID=UPI0020079DEA|nr:uncharacterized protein F4807DRAFT_443269 [Annulohypoxylon truncatum]KAI1205427.1 hypothetical protein F4807DRAFT_443269 [Annulohypoxylon truncatum]
MGWWNNLWSSNTTDDPLRSLDPKLREFLEKESPVKYSAAQQQREADQAARPKQQKNENENKNEAGEKSNKPVVPPQSQFQDGRYAHIWKTYRPLADIEAETKSDHEKLMDVLEGYKERKGQIGKAALENCALEQVDWRKCMNNPTISERMTMCRDQIKKFERCYFMQTRLLKALGYLSTYNHSPETEEDIQLHADALYQRLLSQEAEIAAAKQEGRPIPQFPPLIPRTHQLAQLQQQRQEELTAEQEAAIMERLKKVPQQDRAAEEEAIRAEWRAKDEVASQVEGIWRKQDMDREERKRRGEETMWDKLSGAFRSSGGGEGENKR